MGAILSCIRYVPHLLSALRHVLLYFLDYVVLKKPGSYPGDPIANPLKRRGKWSDQEIRSLGGWRFSADAESVDISERSSTEKLTGESAGRQIWYKDDRLRDDDVSVDKEFTFCASENPNSGDKVFREIMLRRWKGPVPDESSRPQTAKEAARKALEFYQMLQCEDGHWAGDYGGPMFLMPGLLTTLFITKAEFPQYKKAAMVTYLRNHQQLDGGWGTHIECASTMFGTVLSYVALRLLGESPSQKYMEAGKEFIRQHKGALFAPSWAKFWLACLGVYEWEGINSIPAELWLLPRWLPFHPGKLWCHCRMVYLPMCYLYCTRFKPADMDTNEILIGLREELFCEKYDTIDWDAHRQTCAPIDEYSQLNPVMKLAQDFLSYYEWLMPKLPFFQSVRQYSLKFVIAYIHAEDDQTNYVDIGPVNKALNMLSVWHDGGCINTTAAFKKHLLRVDDYLWVAEDGMKMQGYNGSQCWDTSFAAQAIVEGDMVEDFPECCQNVYNFLRRTQIASDEENREFYFRHVSKGGWPFSTASHGWPISDCTSEGLKTILAFHDKRYEAIFRDCERIPDESLKDAVNVILTLHNTDGGWATYENNRGERWYEMMNPSEVFGDIMIDYSYVECSCACISALKNFSKDFPDHRSAEVLNAIEAGARFIKSIQRDDGSWYGSWGVCFIYGTWFGIEGLVNAGVSTSSAPIKKAVSFLLSKQNPNGGWGESYVACVNKSYPADGTGEGLGEDGSGVVQTAWALLGLMSAGCPDELAVERGIKYLMKKQLPNGDWAQEGITGVFNRSCGITYTAYRNVFPMWALARYGRLHDK